MPIIQLIPGMGRWDEIAVGPFMVGRFIGAPVTFLIVAFVIFVIVKISKRWGNRIGQISLPSFLFRNARIDELTTEHYSRNRIG
jgi:large-conductance mechanosensitive channel